MITDIRGISGANFSVWVEEGRTGKLFNKSSGNTEIKEEMEEHSSLKA
jgi:hypothetical protein